MRCERAQTRYSTPRGHEQHGGLDERELAPRRAVEGLRVTREERAEYHGRNSVSINAAAHAAACCISRGSALNAGTSFAISRAGCPRPRAGAGAFPSPSLLQVPVDHRAHREQQVAQRLGELARELGRHRAAQPRPAARPAPAGRARRPRTAPPARCCPTRAAARPAPPPPRPGAGPPGRAAPPRRARRRDARAPRPVRRGRWRCPAVRAVGRGRRRQAKRTTSAPSSSAAPGGPERGERGREHDRAPPAVHAPRRARRRPS